MTDPRHLDRVQTLIAAAVAGLDPADRAERIAQCRNSGQHGVRMVPGGDGVIELLWGGRRLALVAAADLFSDEPLAAEFTTDAPDTVPEGWT